MATKQKDQQPQPGTRIGGAAAPGGGPSKPDPHRGAGQKVSQERGKGTRNKKNPGKRAGQGG